MFKSWDVFFPKKVNDPVIESFRDVRNLLRFLTSLNDLITGSLTFSGKKTSQYALPTNPTRSDKPYPTPPRSAYALETNALSLTPDYVYEEMQCTSSRVTAAINNILVALHASSMIP